jgi:hypothetical protein
LKLLSFVKVILLIHGFQIQHIAFGSDLNIILNLFRFFSYVIHMTTLASVKPIVKSAVSVIDRVYKDRDDESDHMKTMQECQITLHQL